MPAASLNKTALDAHGWVLVPGVFSRRHIAQLHAAVMARLGLGFHQSNGIALVGLQERPEFDFVRKLIASAPLRAVADAIFADNPHGYRACGPHGIGVNRQVGWHKDRLNAKYRRHQQTPLWGPGSDVQGGHHIYKIGLFMDAGGGDFRTRAGSLRVVPGSHRFDVEPAGDPHVVSAAITIHPDVGDVVVWEQRITHRGMDRDTWLVARGSNRTLVQLGFGANNVFTDEFERGTKERNADHCAQRCANGEFCCWLPGMPARRGGAVEAR